LLVDRCRAPYVNPDGSEIPPDRRFGKFFIYNRPHMAEFVKWAFDHFTVAVWSSAMGHNVKDLVEHIFGPLKHRLAFVWDQSNCTEVGSMADGKPIFLKVLAKVWELPGYARFGPSNTLLVDDSPYKVVRNPKFTALHPAEYQLSVPEVDGVLGNEGALREYLTKLAAEPTVPRFLKDTPWGEHGVEALPSPEEVIHIAKTGIQVAPAGGRQGGGPRGRCGRGRGRGRGRGPSLTDAFRGMGLQQ